MSEDSNYSSSSSYWNDHNFASAKKAFRSTSQRSYTEARSSNKKARDLVPKEIKTNCASPLLILIDVTQSLNIPPTTMFSKMPFLEHEARTYLGPDTEICWAAVGDAYCDDYPFQIRPFTKGKDLKTRIGELVFEEGGGGQRKETYEQAALYLTRKVHMPQAIRKPVLVIVADEQPYPSISPEHAKKWLGINLERTLSTRDVFTDLTEMYSAYLIKIPYDNRNGDQMSKLDKEMFDYWAELLGGENRIAFLTDSERIVDTLFGLLAEEVNQRVAFQAEIEDRQNSDQVKVVYKSLTTIHRGGNGKQRKPGQSITHGLPRSSQQGKKLL